MKFVRKFAAFGAIGLAFAGLAGQVAQAQRPTSLFSDDCVSRGAGSQSRDISIGRQFFTSIFIMENGAFVTCRIRPANSAPKFKTLRLAFGIADDALNVPTEVSIYIDGDKTDSRTISAGDKSFLLIDVAKASSVAIEVKQLRDTNIFTTHVSFFQALLEPINPSSSSPGRRQ